MVDEFRIGCEIRCIYWGDDYMVDVKVGSILTLKKIGRDLYGERVDGQRHYFSKRFLKRHFEVVGVRNPNSNIILRD